MKITRNFDEYLTLLASSVNRYGRQSLFPKDAPESLLMGFEGPEGWVTVKVSSLRAWANLDSPMMRQVDHTTGKIIYRRDSITEKLIANRVNQAVTNAWKGVAPIKESPRILH